MIKLKEQAIKDISELNSVEVARIYELISYFKEKKKPSIKADSGAYLRVREALQGISTSLADDISFGREETI
jgi:hypothetical protein